MGKVLGEGGERVGGFVLEIGRGFGLLRLGLRLWRFGVRFVVCGWIFTRDERWGTGGRRYDGDFGVGEGLSDVAWLLSICELDFFFGIGILEGEGWREGREVERVGFECMDLSGKTEREKKRGTGQNRLFGGD